MATVSTRRRETTAAQKGVTASRATAVSDLRIAGRRLRALRNFNHAFSRPATKVEDWNQVPARSATRTVSQNPNPKSKIQNAIRFKLATDSIHAFNRQNNKVRDVYKRVPDMIKSWMAIAGITFLVAVASFFVTPRDVKWFARLTRPRWLIFEPLIPFIWTTIFVCGAISANLVWQKAPGSLLSWFLMGCYLLLEIVTVLYIPLMLRFHSLRIGEILGSVGVLLGLLLTVFVLPVSPLAAVLLIPYLIWSPVGTYTTEELIQLNPQDA